MEPSRVLPGLVASSRTGEGSINAGALNRRSNLGHKSAEGNSPEIPPISGRCPISFHASRVDVGGLEELI